MKKGREVEYKNRDFGEFVRFPPNHLCWQTTIADAFRSDRRSANTTPFSPGDYVMTVELILENGPTFRFQSIRQKFDLGGNR